MAVTRSKTSTLAQRSAKHAYATRHSTKRAKPSTKQTPEEKIEEMQGNEPGRSFPLFPQLPAELQRLIWKQAGPNCFRQYSTKSHIVRKGNLIENVQRRNYRRALDNKPWLALLPTCKTAYDVVESIDMERRRDTGRRKEQYWSRNWIANKSGFLPDEDRTAEGYTFVFPSWRLVPALAGNTPE